MIDTTEKVKRKRERYKGIVGIWQGREERN